MNYLFKIFTTGAVRKTPDKVIRTIITEIDNPYPINIVEFGAGQGEITKQLIQKRDISINNYLAFELDRKLGNQLEELAESVEVLYQNAFEFESYIPVNMKVNYFICAIPLSFYSFKKIKSFILQMKNHIEDDGKIIIIFNAVWLIPFLRKILGESRITLFFSLPIYFLIKSSPR